MTCKTLKKKNIACNDNINWNMFLDEEVKCNFNNRIKDKFKEHVFASKNKKIDYKILLKLLCLQSNKLDLKRNKIPQVGIASVSI